MDRPGKSSMNNHYQHIFFDLDHTLWDFDSNTEAVMRQLYTDYQLARLGVSSFELLMEQFKLVNYALWDRYNKGEIGKEDIRATRFPSVLHNLGVADKSVTKEMGEDFLYRSPRQTGVITGTYELLDYLKPRYPLHILTNGFDEVQRLKIESAGLTDYFQELITSETTGRRKPDPDFFHISLNLVQAEAHTVIMIGDNLETDIKGAQAASIDQVYYNPAGKKHSVPVTHEITQLTDLLQIL